MTYELSRGRAILLWFLAVALIAGIWMAFGTRPSAGTAAMLVGLSVVPPCVFMLIWPGPQSLSARHHEPDDAPRETAH